MAEKEKARNCANSLGPQNGNGTFPPGTSLPPSKKSVNTEARIFRDLVTAGHAQIHRDMRGGVWWTAPDYRRDPGSLSWVAKLWTTAWPWFAVSQDSGTDRRRRKLINPGMLARRSSAMPWISENLDRLLASGWSRRGIFRAGKHPSPVGDWGLCWSASWADPDLLSVNVTKSGGVAFLLAEASGREVVQTARPV